MAKPKRKKRKPGSGYQAPTVDPGALLLEIDEVRGKLSAEKVGAEWGTVQRLLVKGGSDASTVARAIALRDLELVDQLIAKIRDPDLEI